MPGLLIEPQERHPHKTAGGATAAPRGTQPILVQTECALTAFSPTADDSGSGGFWLERMFPKALRDRHAAVQVPGVTDAGPAVEFCSSACTAIARRGRLHRINRFTSASGEWSLAGLPRGSGRALLSWSTGCLPLGSTTVSSTGTRKRTVRHCRRRAINEKRNARQCAAARGKPDCNRRELGPRRAVHRA